jgi:phosphate transport system permease protein
MTDIMGSAPVPASRARRSSLMAQDALSKRRNAAEARFKIYGIVAIVIAMLALVWLLISIFSVGLPSFRQTFLTMPIELPADKLDKSGVRDVAVMSKVTTVGYAAVIQAALEKAIKEKGIDVGTMTPKDIAGVISLEAPAQLRNYVLANPELVGTTIDFEVLANGRIDGFFKGRVTMESAQLDSNVKPEQLVLAEKLTEAGIMAKRFNWGFITAPDASDQRPEAAGLGVAIIGSFYMMIVVLVLSLPIGVAASVYLEEFAPKNRWTDLIEVNIANLAAVPSIVFGILGLAVFINFAGLPQSAPIVGGLVLTLMTLPRIIIPARAALKSVPPSIRDAALGVGASKLQSVFHHVLPLAAPGILTGMIIGLAQALGETAPLLLIGMVAFVRDYPGMPLDGFFNPASALPVQVFSWTTRGDPGFVERASGAIIVLLVFMLIMNAIAIILRRRFERRW